jgi:hypothetical protein
MATNKKKLPMIVYLAIIALGCVFAFSSLIANEYLKLFIVLLTLAVGLYGVMKGLSSNPKSTTEVEEEIN